jgi:hypothetical protein
MWAFLIIFIIPIFIYLHHIMYSQWESLICYNLSLGTLEPSFEAKDWHYTR